jgi:hypothetical protein
MIPMRGKKKSDEEGAKPGLRFLMLNQLVGTVIVESNRSYGGQSDTRHYHWLRRTSL